MRVEPNALVGIGIWVLYVVIITVVSKINGVPYDEIGDSTSNLLRGAVISLAIGGLIIAGLSAWPSCVLGVAARLLRLRQPVPSAASTSKAGLRTSQACDRPSFVPTPGVMFCSLPPSS
ncbi:MAG: hypothetical protein V9E98_12030 [Candidatus Nanopelagicales bacterium]